MAMNKIIALCFFLLPIFSVTAGEVVFKGYPSKKIEVTEQGIATSEMTRFKSSEHKVVIEKEGDNYYWRTRNNLQLVPAKSGAYITYYAVNGAGYVRVLNDIMWEMLSEREKQKSYLYMEHLVHQLGSITYYGR